VSEADAAALSTDGPVAREWLLRDLRALGLRPGMLLMVHCAMSELGWVVGSAVTVVAALRAAVGEGGTLVLPTFSGGNSDPARWRHPGVPESWWPAIRAGLPAHDRHAPLRGMGAVAEYFVHLPGVARSAHPACSWAAQGPLAEAVTANHNLDFSLGEGSPLGRCYDLDGHALGLGTVRTTVLHLAEHRATYPGKETYAQGAALSVDGARQWVVRQELQGNDDDFEELRQDYMRTFPAGEAWREGRVGYYETARLFAVRPLVDFAVKWLEAHRASPDP
jgi:aminoglycoside 3-N-acetyltransferase